MFLGRKVDLSIQCKDCSIRFCLSCFAAKLKKKCLAAGGWTNFRSRRCGWRKQLNGNGADLQLATNQKAWRANRALMAKWVALAFRQRRFISVFFKFNAFEILCHFCVFWLHLHWGMPSLINHRLIHSIATLVDKGNPAFCCRRNPPLMLDASADEIAPVLAACRQILALCLAGSCNWKIGKVGIGDFRPHFEYNWQIWSTWLAEKAQIL